MSQEKRVVSKDFSEEKELEQMLQGRVKKIIDKSDI